MHLPPRTLAVTGALIALVGLPAAGSTAGAQAATSASTRMATRHTQVATRVSHPAGTYRTHAKVSRAGSAAASLVLDPSGITAGPNGALWFTNAGVPNGGGAEAIGQIDPATGAITNYTIPGVPEAETITAGPDGALWFTEEAADGTPSIGRITTSGAVTLYTADGILPTTALTASPNPTTRRHAVTITATVSPNDGGGTVSFSVNKHPIPGCSALPLHLVSGSKYKATCTVSSLTLGSHVILGAYSGDANYTSSSGRVTEVVNS